MPTSPTSADRAPRRLERHRPPRRASASSSTTRRALRGEASGTSPGRPPSATDEGTVAAAQWLVWEASQATGRPLGEHPRAVHGPRPRRGRRLHGPGDQHPGPDLRHGPDRLRGGRGGRRRRGHPGARPERADVHLPAPHRLRDRRPRRGDRRRLAGAGLHPGRPLPVQRQEVRGRPRGDDRGDPAGLPPGDRRRLPQHRHRLVDARRPLEADGRRAAARELRARGRADGAHPDARDATA